MSTQNLWSLTAESTSDAAAATYMSPEFRREADKIMHRTTSLEQLVERASKIINLEFATRKESIKIVDGKIIRLDRVMLAMLASAEEAGGEDATRYIASRILACQNDAEKLAAVGYTWLAHFLFIFKTSRNSDQSNPTSSAVTKPANVMKKLLVRDGYRCVVTRVQDYKHPTWCMDKPAVYLKGAYILPRVLALYRDDEHNESHKATSATLDILANFTCLSSEQIAKMSTLIDHPSNRMLLDVNLRDTFDAYRWCFQKTKASDTYNLKAYDKAVLLLVQLWGGNPHAPITFKDHRGEFNNASQGLEPQALPNPDFISIHAAVAEILHRSGAGRFFDALLYRYDHGSTYLSSWMDLETMIVTEQIRKTLSLLASVHVGA